MQSLSPGFLPWGQSGGVWVAGTSSGSAGRPGGERGPADMWHLSSQPEGHQYSGGHGAFSSHGRSLAVCWCSRASSEAPGLQEAPMAGRPLAPAAGLPARPPALVRPPASSGAAPSFPRPSLPLGLPLLMLNPPQGHLPPGAPRPDDDAPSSQYCLSLGPGASSEPPSRPAAMGPTPHLLLICQA